MKTTKDEHGFPIIMDKIVKAIERKEKQSFIDFNKKDVNKWGGEMARDLHNMIYTGVVWWIQNNHLDKPYYIIVDDNVLNLLKRLPECRFRCDTTSFDNDSVGSYYGIPLYVNEATWLNVDEGFVIIAGSSEIITNSLDFERAWFMGVSNLITTTN